jgi:hypothetical protein
MKHPRLEAIDKSDESTITIQPDGRIYAFGITRGLVEVLAAIPTGNERTRRMLGLLTGPLDIPGVPETPAGEGPRHV